MEFLWYKGSTIAVFLNYIYFRPVNVTGAHPGNRAWEILLATNYKR